MNFPPGIDAVPAVFLHRDKERLRTRSGVVSHEEVRWKDRESRPGQQRGLGSGKWVICKVPLARTNSIYNIIMAGMAVFNVAGYLIEERRRWPVITASP